MSNDRGGRKILWWSLPIKPEDGAEVGARMLWTVVIWFGAIVAVAAIIGVVLAIF